MLTCKKCREVKDDDGYITCVKCREINKEKRRSRLQESNRTSLKLAELLLLSVVNSDIVASIREGMSNIKKYFHTKRVIRNVEEIECPICFDDIAVNESVYDLECGHKFHTHCLLFNLNMSNTCPMCRRELCSKFNLDELLNSCEHVSNAIKERLNFC